MIGIEITSDKEKAISIIEKLPNNLNLHQIAYELEMEQQLQNAQLDSDAGRVLSLTKVRERFIDWLE